MSQLRRNARIKKKREEGDHFSSESIKIPPAQPFAESNIG